MGFCIAPDIFQEQMSAPMDDFEFVRFYLNNFPVITLGFFEENLAKVKEVMKRLRLVGLKFKIETCKFVVPKVEYLGYIITLEGIKSDPEKSKQLSILNSLRIKMCEAVPIHGTILLWIMAEVQWDIGTSYGIE